MKKYLYRIKVAFKVWFQILRGDGYIIYTTEKKLKSKELEYYHSNVPLTFVNDVINDLEDTFTALVETHNLTKALENGEDVL